MEGTYFGERTRRTSSQGYPPTWTHITISWREAAPTAPPYALGFCYCPLLETPWSPTRPRKMRGFALSETPCAKRET